MIYKNLSNKAKYIMIGLFVLSVAFTLIYNKNYAPSTNCQNFDEFVKDSYSGIVLNKYNNQKNKNVKTLTVNKNGKPWEFMVLNDTLFFNFIKVGDSLVKIKNEDFIEIHRSNTVTNFNVNFDCETSKKTH